MAALEPTHLHRHLDDVRAKAHHDVLSLKEQMAEKEKEYKSNLKEARRAHAFDVTQLQGEIRGERAEFIEEEVAATDR